MTEAGQTVRERDLEARVEALEKTVATLERRVADLAIGDAAPAPPGNETPTSKAAASAPAPAIDPVFRSSAPPRASARLAPSDPGQWAGRLGIALLLLGAVFGFRYSIERGWIGPSMRVATGLGLAALLVAAASRLRPTRPGLSRLLAGGGIGSAYLSAYAAYAFYDLVSHTAAFAAMSLVTVAAWFLSVREDDAAAAVLATGVGLATPFLLSSGSGDVEGLVLYTSLVVAGAAAVFARAGWALLLWTTSAGAWTVLALAADAVRGGTSDAAAVSAGVVVVAAATWGLAVVRELLSAADPARWRPLSSGIPAGDLLAGAIGRGGLAAQAHQLALATPTLAMLVAASAWGLGDTGNGRVALALSAVAAGSAAALASRGVEVARGLASTHVASAAVMLAFAMSSLLGDDLRRWGLAMEAFALLAVAKRTGGSWPATVGHAVYLVVVLETAQRLGRALDAPASSFALAEAADLMVIAACAAASRLAPRAGAPLFLVAAQVLLLLWLAQVLRALPGGDALVTAAWFANAVTVVVAGLRTDSGATRRLGAALMALTMGKLFVHDLATVDPFWRIVVFAGFGLVLLALGYAFPALWKKPEPAEG